MTRRKKMKESTDKRYKRFVILLLSTAAVAQRSLTSANCRRIENKDRCVIFGCDQIRLNFNIQYCTNDLRDWIWDISRKCYMPTFSKCFETRPPNNLIPNNNDNTQITCGEGGHLERQPKHRNIFSLSTIFAQ
uniref:Uncharacterized protein n=1 Tax=Romanomermis culicivorax TaxID=13658 RepID=A0A915INX1_ROMCU